MKKIWTIEEIKAQQYEIACQNARIEARAHHNGAKNWK